LVDKDDLKDEIRSFFRDGARDELATRDRFYLALGSLKCELNSFFTHQLQDMAAGLVDDTKLHSYEYVQKFEKSRFKTNC